MWNDDGTMTVFYSFCIWWSVITQLKTQFHVRLHGNTLSTPTNQMPLLSHMQQRTSSILQNRKLSTTVRVRTMLGGPKQLWAPTQLRGATTVREPITQRTRTPRRAQTPQRKRTPPRAKTPAYCTWEHEKSSECRRNQHVTWHFNPYFSKCKNNMSHT